MGAFVYSKNDMRVRIVFFAKKETTGYYDKTNENDTFIY